LGVSPPPDETRFAIDAEDPVRAGLAIARTAQRVGELDVAEATLAELHAGHPDHPEVAGAYARLLVEQARYAEAREVATSAGPLAGLRAEAAGLAAFHLGELDAADAAFAAIEIEAATSADGTAAGRAALLRGMVAHRRGQLGLASERYREAARRFTEAGERHAAAAAELDLGAVLVERGRASDALPLLTGAGQVLADVGSATEACVADLHRSSALLLLGQVDAARAAAEAALARTEQVPQLRARALIVAGDACKRLGDEPAALRHHRESLAIAALRDDARGQLRAHIALAEAGQHDGDGIDVAALCASDDDRDGWTLARGRLALCEPSPSAAPPMTDALARACAEAAGRAVDEDRLERAFRGHAIAAQLAHRAREASLARSEADQARLAHAALVAATAPTFRAVLDGDLDLSRLPGREPIAAHRTAEARRPAFEAPRARSGGASNDASNDASIHEASLPPTQVAPLRRLLALSRRLHTEPSLDRIFDDVIEAAIELSGAERGCLLLRRPDGELAIVAARNWFVDEPDAAGEPASHRSPGRSIAERVAQTGETVIAVDPALQPRVGGARVRSVLAVPLRQRGTITGSLYVDHRLRSGAFDAPTAAVLGELADLAAIAIENARRAADLRRATLEADERNAHLVAELAAHDAELLRVTTELAVAQARPAPTQPVVGDDLRLRPVLAAIEEAYLAAAMTRAHGNQTAAARLLGLSRFGLQKKLRRRPTDDDPE
jgi:GAF domain-containing protein